MTLPNFEAATYHVILGENEPAQRVYAKVLRAYIIKKLYPSTSQIDEHIIIELNSKTSYDVDDIALDIKSISDFLKIDRTFFYVLSRDFNRARIIGSNIFTASEKINYEYRFVTMNELVELFSDFKF